MQGILNQLVPTSVGSGTLVQDIEEYGYLFSVTGDYKPQFDFNGQQVDNVDYQSVPDAKAKDCQCGQ